MGRRGGDRSDWQASWVARRGTGACLIFLVCLGAIVPTGLGLYNLSVQAARAEAWLPEGVPCAVTTAAAFAAPKGAARPIQYGGVVFGRQSGHVDCALLQSWTSNLVGCRFVSSEVISVTRDGRTTYFDAGPGVPAAVLAGPDRLACVRLRADQASGRIG